MHVDWKWVGIDLNSKTIGKSGYQVVEVSRLNYYTSNIKEMNKICLVLLYLYHERFLKFCECIS